MLFRYINFIKEYCHERKLLLVFKWFYRIGFVIAIYFLATIHDLSCCPVFVLLCFCFVFFCAVYVPWYMYSLSYLSYGNPSIPCDNILWLSTLCLRLSCFFLFSPCLSRDWSLGISQKCALSLLVIRQKNFRILLI